jgi:hypothetical protein
MVAVFNGDRRMNPANAINACCRLFMIKQFLAQGIISVLRIEDAKIALASRMAAPPGRKTKAQAEATRKAYLDCYAVLESHIKRHNLDVILALESYSGTSSDGVTYLFPLAEGGKPVPASLRAKKDLFFNGAVPARKFRLATFLYYRGLISYYHVMESIAWQKDRRPLMGQMAMQIGHLTSDQFARIIVRVKNGERFGTVARKEKLLSGPVIAAIVKAQEKYDCRIGRYFIEKGLLSPQMLAKAENDMRLHNNKYG